MATRIGAGLSTAGETREAVREAARSAAGDLAGGGVDLAFLFLSPAHLAAAEEAVEALEEELRPRHLLGCVADGVVAGTHEVEDGPAAAVWAGSLPGAEIETFHAVATELEEEIAVSGFPDLGEPSLVSLLVDPYTFPVAAVLESVNEEHPGLPLVGGIAGGGGAPGTQALVVDGEVHAEGAAGAVVSGVPVATLVSQGCAPIGRDAVVTSAEHNIVFELAGRPALERLRAEVVALAPEEQRLAAGGVLAGLVMDENKADYGRGDFLMRGVIGADEASGALAIAESVRVGQTLRFHVRDAGTADVDLRRALDEALEGQAAAGALLFTCNGRGTHMFPLPHHDASAVCEALGAPAVAGFFCGGEIGPVGSRVFLHGFTATAAVFLEPSYTTAS